MFWNNDYPDGFEIVPLASPPPSTPSAFGSVHGDPMFHVPGAAPQHFWLSTGQLTPLLQWNASNAVFTLSGKTFENPLSGNQWFDQIDIRKDGAPVLDMRVAHAGKRPNVSVAYADASVQVSPDTLAPTAAVDAGGLQLEVFSTSSKKFNSSAEGLKYRHLNLKFKSALPAGASGVFSELAGMRQMSDATTALLKPAGPH